jgi:hypothetical protein
MSRNRNFQSLQIGNGSTSCTTKTFRPKSSSDATSDIGSPGERHWKASCFLLVDVFQARGFLVDYVSTDPVLIFWAQVHMPLVSVSFILGSGLCGLTVVGYIVITGRSHYNITWFTSGVNPVAVTNISPRQEDESHSRKHIQGAWSPDTSLVLRSCHHPRNGQQLYLFAEVKEMLPVTRSSQRRGYNSPQQGMTEPVLRSLNRAVTTVEHPSKDIG